MASDFKPHPELSEIRDDENRLEPGKDYQIDLQGGNITIIHFISDHKVVPIMVKLCLN